MNAEDYRGLNKVMHEMDQAEEEGFVAVTTPEILLFEKSVWARPWNYLVTWAAGGTKRSSMISKSPKLESRRLAKSGFHPS